MYYCYSIQNVLLCDALLISSDEPDQFFFILLCMSYLYLLPLNWVDCN